MAPASAAITCVIDRIAASASAVQCVRYVSVAYTGLQYIAISCLLRNCSYFSSCIVSAIRSLAMYFPPQRLHLP